MGFKFILFDNLREREKSKAIENLIEDSSPSQEFYLMLSLATGIATIGLITDNIPIIIGSMLIAPLIYPIVALGLSLEIGSIELSLRSLKTFLVSTIFGLFIALILTMIFRNELTLHQEAILVGIKPSVAFSTVSFLSGIAASFAYSKPTLNTSLTGVAISVAIIPPLAATGIGLAIGNIDLMLNSFSQYLINFVLISVASWIVFYFMKFDTKEKTVETELDEEKKEIKKDIKYVENKKKSQKDN